MGSENQVVERRSRWLRRLAGFILFLIVLVLIVEAAVAVRAGMPAALVARWLSYRLPMLFYLWAIWTMRQAFGRIADGELFDRVLPALLGRLGFALAGGAFATVLVSPLLEWAVRGFHRGPYASFDPAAITLGLVGLLLVVLSRLFSRAAAMQRELDEIL